jgi:DNA polymerase III gamma/tau subunit
MSGVSKHALNALEAHRDDFSPGDLVRMLSMLSTIEPQFRRSTQQQLLVEMLLVRFALLDRAVSIEDVLKTLGGGGGGGGGAQPRNASAGRAASTVPPIADMPSPAARVAPAADWKAKLEETANSATRPARLTTEAVKEERLRMLRAQDPVFDAAVRELDLDLLD